MEQTVKWVDDIIRNGSISGG